MTAIVAFDPPADIDGPYEVAYDDPFGDVPLLREAPAAHADAYEPTPIYDRLSAESLFDPHRLPADADPTPAPTTPEETK